MTNEHSQECGASFDDNEEKWFTDARLRDSRRPSQRPTMRPVAPPIDDSVADGWFLDLDV